MITKSQNYSYSIKCSICRNEIRERATFYQSGITCGVICVDCYKRFSNEDLDLIANLFLAYGGYFGQYKRSQFSILKILQAIYEDLFPLYRKRGLEELNIRMLHKALLHGISPQEYIENLNLLIK
ncbi:MAG: hypothetical protein ACFFCI_07865 [Promethearchaeota archaeon]